MTRSEPPDETPLWKLVWIALVGGGALAGIILYFFNG
jgi:hypothetical protein